MLSFFSSTIFRKWMFIHSPTTNDFRSRVDLPTNLNCTISLLLLFFSLGSGKIKSISMWRPNECIHLECFFRWFFFYQTREKVGNLIYFSLTTSLFDYMSHNICQDFDVWRRKCSRVLQLLDLLMLILNNILVSKCCCFSTQIQYGQEPQSAKPKKQWPLCNSIIRLKSFYDFDPTWFQSILS